MTDRCRNCDKPIATDADWETTPEGEGDGLCWGWGTPSCASVDWRSRAMAAEAERDALRAAVVELATAAREMAKAHPLWRVVAPTGTPELERVRVANAALFAMVPVIAPEKP